MNRYKVCVYAICKNEEAFVDRWMDAVSEADMVVVLDTGSTDNTAEKLKARGARVYTEKIIPWRFDTARNIAMDHIPEDIDICVSNDLDEIFEKGWREKLEEAWMPEHTRASYYFVWSHKEDGTPEKQFTMQKIHKRHGYRWVHPVHEILKYDGEENTVWLPGVVLRHYPDVSKPRTQYLPLLELSAAENPEDDRVAFWLGREYMYYGKYEQCIDALTTYLKMPTALWNEERCAAMRFVARSYQYKGNNGAALSWLYKAVAECPGVREPYLQAARLGYNTGNWPLVYLMVERALKITNKSGSYLLEPECWGYSFYDLGAICAYWLGLYDKSLAYAKLACDMEPGNERLRKNLELIKNKLDEARGQKEEEQK